MLVLGATHANLDLIIHTGCSAQADGAALCQPLFFLRLVLLVEAILVNRFYFSWKRHGVHQSESTGDRVD